MEFPSDLRYTKEHEWVRLEGGGAVMGITEFAQSELGDIVFTELPPVGKSVTQGATLCVVESTKAASDVYAPVSGKVREVNGNLNNAPELINHSPYNEGWMVKLADIRSDELEKLMTPAQYKEFLGPRAK